MCTAKLQNAFFLRMCASCVLMPILFATWQQKVKLTILLALCMHYLLFLGL